MKNLYFASFAEVLLMVFLILVNLKGLPPIVPLSYSRPWGEEQLVPHYLLLVIPLAVTVFLLLNLTLAKLISGAFFIKASRGAVPNQLTLYILSGLSVLIVLLGFITIVQILLTV